MKPWVLATICFIFLVLSAVFLRMKPDHPAKPKASKVSQIEKPALQIEQFKLPRIQNAEFIRLEKLWSESTAGTAVWQERGWEVSNWLNKNGMQVEAALFAARIASTQANEQNWQKVTEYGLQYFMSAKPDLRQDTLTLLSEIASKKGLELNSKNPAFRTAIVMQDFEKNPMIAVTALKSIETEFPDYDPVQKILVSLSLRSGQWDKAEKRLQNLMHKLPKDPIVNCLMVDLLEMTNRSSEAESYLINCIKK